MAMVNIVNKQKTRIKSIRVPLLDEELKEYKEQAKEMGLSGCDYVRYLIKRHRRKLFGKR